MSLWAQIQPDTAYRRVMVHLRTPLYRNGYALTLSSVLTSGFGVAYWVLAARSYPAPSVGLNSAAISMMMFLAGVSQLNLMSALIRFIPGAGRSARSLVISAYLMGAAVAAVVSAIFLGWVGFWAPALGFLRSEPWLPLWFVLATVAWCIFVLQDSVLTGLQSATWVPLENTAFAVAKICLLVVFARFFSAYGVFASWTLALLASLIPTNLFIFAVLLPRHARGTRTQTVAATPAQIARFVAADYVGSLFWLGCTTLLPVLVAEGVGAAANAYFYLTWTIAYSLYLVSPNMGSSLIVEAATDEARLSEYSRKVFLSTMRLLLPAVTLLVILAPYVLAIFGQAYRQEATLLLRLLALSALPNVINAQFVSARRATRRMLPAVLSLAGLSALALLLSYVLMRKIGIVGVGVAWLAGQLLLAAILYAGYFRRLWSGQTGRPVLAPSGPRGRRRSLTASLASGMRRLVALFRQFHWSRRFSHLVPAILAHMPPDGHEPSPETWTDHRMVPTVSDHVVILLGPAGGAPAGVLKISASDQGVSGMHSERDALRSLLNDSRLGEWRALLPACLDEGQTDGYHYVVQQALPGVDARRLLVGSRSGEMLAGLAAGAIAELHRRTAYTIVVEEAWLAKWVDRPLSAVARVVSSSGGNRSLNGALDRLASELRGALAGRTLAVSWVHGDFAPGNVLVAPDASSVTGIIDWELARPDGLPSLDLVQMLLSIRTIVGARELGPILKDLLSGEAWWPYEHTLLAQTDAAFPGQTVPLRTALSLCWLGHVSANLEKSARYNGNRYWVANNIRNVIECL